MLTLTEAKAYLRVDSDFEDDLIASLIASAQSLCMSVARLTAEEWNALENSTEESREPLLIRGDIVPAAEVRSIRENLRTGMLYTLGYLYEHREEADHHDLVLTLRSLLFAVREGVV